MTNALKQMSVFGVVDYPIFCDGLWHLQKLCLPLTFNVTLPLSTLVLTGIQVVFLSTTYIGMLSDQFWKIGALNIIRPNLRAQLMPMVGLHLLLTMKNLHRFVWPCEFLTCR